MSGSPSPDASAATGFLDSLRPLRQRAPAPEPGERCEMCALPIAEGHGHVVNLESRHLLCTCRPCTLLFTRAGAAQGRFRAVPERCVFLDGFRLDEPRWDALQIPVRMAFFFRNSALGRMAGFYPSPAGVTESLLPLEGWEEMVRENPVLRELEPDVEALLVYGPRQAASFDCFLVPIDACYELAGVVRRTWRGFDGGGEAHAAIADFFERLRGRSVLRQAEEGP